MQVQELRDPGLQAVGRPRGIAAALTSWSILAILIQSCGEMGRHVPTPGV